MAELVYNFTGVHILIDKIYGNFFLCLAKNMRGGLNAKMKNLFEK